ncbi:MAG: rhomboid family intramembrane serine protease [Flavobacteriales bacterium]|nr:rhomboid family intramembrane serine protease [Flavobacteriales bacterium]MCX7650609.1 rhomboid family intramembrane serine protease [Flavobacteriales bacterium]MDW8431229.1 rhomboid family intramembrane serine protease [Flavobacteriales bacterium]
MSYYGAPSFRLLTPVIKNLLIINGLVYLFSIAPDTAPFVYRFLPLYYFQWPAYVEPPLGSLGMGLFYPWQLLTYMFVHGSFSHLFFNMFSMWMFGSVLENLWGSRRFLNYYIICGLGAALVHQLYHMAVFHAAADVLIQLNVAQTPAVGASGAVYGLLLAYGLLFPNTELFIMLIPFPIKAKYAVAGLLFIDLFLAFAGFSWDNVAHFAHLGGALTGFLILLYWRRQGLWYRRRW